MINEEFRIQIAELVWKKISTMKYCLMEKEKR